MMGGGERKAGLNSTLILDTIFFLKEVSPFNRIGHKFPIGFKGYMNFIFCNHRTGRDWKIHLTHKQIEPQKRHTH